MFKTRFSQKVAGIASVIACCLIAPAQATIVQFKTSLGDFEVNLYDETTPKTVANFLSYVNEGDYKNIVMHRSVPGFIIQGGGFYWGLDTASATADDYKVLSYPAKASVENEPKWSSRRGTIAMAKLGGQPDSATSQWFFNLADNQAILDNQNEGFTTFGQVIGDGMEIVDAMAAVPIFTYASPFGEVPLRNFSETDRNNNEPVTDSQFILIESIEIVNANVDTAADLTLIENTTATSTPDNGGTDTPATGGSSSGGSANWFMVMLLMLGITRKFAGRLNK
ncbi:peptidylprolyl isomerase [Algibacillus agarilyticus]|uniref:peptidylprolyl isomerase n=1 Tax=Algibacillus agarilyticus TaxID=2234133 RepID=UPI000DCF68D3|nr:peptidylprolyl isomerase [Algibacillus agarilyticus]